MFEEFILTRFIDLGYFLFLIPFRICSVRNEKNLWEYELIYRTRSGNFTHKLICGLLLILATCQGVLMTRGSYVEKVVRKPRVMFAIWKTLHVGPILICLWGYTFFWKQGAIIDIFQGISKIRPVGATTQNQNHTGWKVYLTIVPLLLLGVVCPLLIETAAVLDNDGESHWENFRRAAASILFDLFLQESSNVVIPEMAFTPSLQLITILYIVLRAWGGILLFMAQLLVLMGTLFLYTQTRQLHKNLEENDCTYKKLMLGYSQLRRLVKGVNHVNGPVMLCLLSASVPFFVLQIFNAWDSNHLSLKFTVLTQFLIYLATFILASEAQYKGELLKGRLLELSHRERDGKSSGRIFRQEIGLAVGYFGMISFGVMGSMFSAYLSYAIMTLQIKAPVFKCK